MKVHFFALIMLFSISAFAGHSGEPPSELTSFVADEETAVDWIVGDLNLDGRSDYLLLTENNDESCQRTLLILVRQTDGMLKVVAKNGTIIICDLYAGSHGGFDLTVRNGFFEVQNSWGGAHGVGWQRFRFTWEKKKKQWLLTKVTEGSASDDPKEQTRKTKVPNVEISFDDFNGDDFDVQWKNRG